MRTLPSWVAGSLSALIVLLFPVVVTLTNVRLLMTPLFPRIEYALPGFPDDYYGFTREDRLKWADIAIDYLLNNEGIEFLADLRFPPGQTAPPASCQFYLDGDCNRLYNDRELRHMVDVKVVTRWALITWALGGAALLLSAAVLYYFGQAAALRSGLVGGAGLTLLLLLSMLIYLLVNFDVFFTQFHQVFFEGDTWLFLWTDTLIRLFPVRFWQDAFIFVSGATIIEALLIGAWARFRLK
jgi:integral membrane protein (TIGR01906 family)